MTVVNRLVVGAAIVDDLAAPTRVWCAQRAYPAALRGLWELPGGKVEDGEVPEIALRRELAEELGVDGDALVLGAVLPGPTPSGDWPIPGAPSENPRALRVWFAELVPGDVPARGPDHLALEQHGADTITALPWLPADVPIAAALATVLAHGGRA